MVGVKVYRKKVATSESTGAAGEGFENRVNGLFAVLMLCNGELAILPGLKVSRLEFQTKDRGYELDDTLIVLRDSKGDETKILAQIKRSLALTSSNKEFRETITGAWLDYNNRGLFNKDKDYCLLATGPLARKDTNAIGWLCNRAQYCDIEDEFEDRILNSPAISKSHKELYCTIKQFILKTSKGDVVAGREIKRFLTRFLALQPDCFYRKGLVESFAYSLLSKSFPRREPKDLFNAIVDNVCAAKEASGVLTCDGLCKRLVLTDEECKGVADTNIVALPQIQEAGIESGANDISSSVAVHEGKNGSKLQDEDKGRQLKNALTKAPSKDKVALLSLIGTWNETVEVDKKFLREVLSESEETVDRLVQELTELGLIETKSGISHVVQRRMIWRTTAKAVTKLNVDRFISCSKTELTRIDASLAIAPGERFISGVSGRKDFASEVLRGGIAKGMAMLVVDSRFCAKIAYSEQSAWGCKFVRCLLGKSDWRIWATLDDEIRYISEVAPDEFMCCLRTFMRKRKGGLAALYDQETGGFMSRTYSVGVVEALSCLAWIPSLLGEVVAVLAEMVRCDPGGQWHPRPIDKFRCILHPLAPHTWASQTRRVSLVRGIIHRFGKDIGWKLIETLLPVGYYSFTVSSNFPIFRGNGKSGKPQRQTNREIWDEYDEYCKMAIQLCELNAGRIGQLINDALRGWTDVSFCALVSYAKDICFTLKEDARFDVWRSIRNAIYYANLSNQKESKKWIANRIKAYKVLESTYQPTDVMLRSRVLFSWRDEQYDKELNNWTGDDIRKRQEEAIVAIRQLKGAETALVFASKTDKSEFAGYLTGLISNSCDDRLLLPKLLSEPKDGLYWPVAGYVSGRFESQGWEWVDSIDMSKWSSESIATLFLMLPFRKDVWSRVAETLGDNKKLYWEKKEHPYVEEIADVRDAVDGLLSVGCGYKAIDVVAHIIASKKGDVVEESRQIMKAFVEGRVHENPTTMTYHNVGEVISYVQASKSVPDDEKAQIEWTFIDLADWHGGHGFKAVYLGAKLATDAKLFCEAVRSVYLPEKEAKKIKEKQKDNPLPQEELHRIENIWNLLEHGQHAPGFGDDGRFNPVVFKGWVKKVLSVAKKEDRLSSTKGVLGRMFFNAVNKGEDFWLPHEIAKLMEKKGNVRMLRSFEVAMFNSRGVHHVDKTGKDDAELAAKYEKMADEAEGFGYNGLAREVRHIANIIKEDWKRSKNEDDSLTAYFDANKEDRDQCRIEDSNES